MVDQSCINLSESDRELLREAIAACVRSRHPRAAEMEALTPRLHRASNPKITVGVKNGMVYWVTGNPFPIRICDYDINGVVPQYNDELGRPCAISFALEDGARKRNRYTVES